MNKDVERGKIVRVPFRVAYTVTVSKTTNTSVFSELEIVPANLGSRVAQIGPNFEYYRVTELGLKQIVSSNGPTHYDSNILNATLGMVGGYHAAAFVPSDTTRTGTPTGLGGLAECPCYDFGAVRNVVSFAVPRSVLMGAPLKWWNTSSTGSPTETLVQGLLYHQAYNEETNDQANSPKLVITLSGMIEFKGMILPSLSFVASQGADKATQLVDESKSSCNESEYQIVRQSGHIIPSAARGLPDKGVPPASRVVMI